MDDHTFDYRRLRGILASQRISHTRFAQVCGLSRSLVARVLTGTQPGELARIKIERGLRLLGLDKEYANAS